MHSIATILRNQRDFLNAVGRPLAIYDLGDVERLFEEPRTLPLVKNTEGWQLIAKIVVTERDIGFVRAYIRELVRDTDYAYGIVGESGPKSFTIGVFEDVPVEPRIEMTRAEFLEGIDPRIPTVGN